MSQFVLLPLRSQAREGRLRLWPDSAVAVLPVLAVHENSMLEAWPSQARIASLAGVSKTTLGPALRFLVEQDWISLFKRKTRRAWHTVYRMEYQHYRKGKSGAASLYIAIDHALVLSGVWGKMSGATKKVFLVLLAHCSMLSENDPTPFLPAERILPGEFARLAGIPERTFRFSRNWLFEWGVIVVEDSGNGWLFPLIAEGMAISVPRTGNESTASPFEHEKTAISVPRQHPSGNQSTACGNICTASGNQSTGTISSIFSIKEEKDSYLPYKLEKQPLPPQQVPTHVRNTPNARSHAGQHEEKNHQEEKRLEGLSDFMRLFQQTVDEDELEELRRERRHLNRTFHPPSILKPIRAA